MTFNRFQSENAKQVMIVMALMMIIVIGAFFRLLNLGDAALRADTIMFWNICRQPLSFYQISTRWIELLGYSSQFPFPLAWTKWFLDIFHLPLTHFTLRLPAAIWGILTIPAFFFLGRRLGGARMGLLMALLLAVNPYHIQVSREAYFYPPMLLGATLMLWSLLVCADSFTCWTTIPLPAFAVHAIGFFLLTYSQPSGWPIAFLCAALISLYCVRSMKKGRKLRTDCVVLLGTYGVLGFPLLIVPWAIKQMMHAAGSASREYSMVVFGSAEQSVWVMVYETLTAFAWGRTPFRACFTFLVLASSIVFLIRVFRRDWRYMLLPGLLIGGFILFNLSRLRTGFGCEPRYVLGLFPVYGSLLALGLNHAFDSMALYRRVGQKICRWATGMVIAFAIGACLYPAFLCTQLTGNPTPYKDITQWFNSHLSPGTLVLVDRWFEPWNELKVYASTNVFFTFTVPNEPRDAYIRNRWRETAVDFFQRYPDAAFLEIAKQYWTVPEIGPWHWPREFFRHHIAITNMAGLKLRRLGLANRGGFYSVNTNRLIVEIFYNTPEDVVDKSRKAGKQAIVWFGKGWGYVKTQDLMDWRVLRKEAALEINNLTDRPCDVHIRLTGISPSGRKVVQSSAGVSHRFEAQKLEIWRFTLKALAPGRHSLKLIDTAWDMTQAPLLVNRVELSVSDVAEGDRGMVNKEAATD